MEFGIDVSHWNAIADANAVRQNGIAFAWCKATEGAAYTDPTFALKVNQLRAAGITVGAYHFMRAGDPAAQARYFGNVARAAGCLAPGALLPMFDMEASDVRGNANNIVNAFYDALLPGVAEVYGNLDWWAHVLKPASWGSRNLVGHIARYNGSPGSPGWSYDKLAVHQHTSSGKVPGIPGNVDRNATYGTYTVERLRIGGVVVPPPVTPPPAPVQPADTWTVRPGDTLSRIASAWHVTVSAVAVANGIANPDLIYPGQVIHKPGTSGATPPPVANNSYIVQRGDTLSAIAVAHHTTVAKLVALNHISNPDRIYPGQRIYY